MTFILDEPPSSSDLLSLSTYRPANLPPPPQAPSILQKLLSFISPKWISDFLFTPDPIHLPHFNSPTLTHTALLAHVTTTRTSPEETLHNASRFLFLPAFVADSITFGFGVMQGHELRGANFEQDIPLCMPLRFLRDARSRRLLFATDLPSLDCVLIYSSEHISATTSSAATARFSRSRLYAALQQNGGYVTVPLLLSALLHILEETHVRTCPLCGGVGGCACARAVQLPRHPYDFAQFRNGMEEDFGEFEGIANKLTGQGFQSVQGVRVRMGRVANARVMKEMGNWAIRQSLKGGGSAWESVLFGKQGEENLLESGDDSSDVVKELIKIQKGDYGSPVSGLDVETVEDMGGFALLGDEQQGTELQWWEQADESADGDASESVGEGVKEDLERAMRKKLMDERRKERNRQSAKRSNAKNKKMRQEMQVELDALYEREEQLRAVETKLRKENLTLKELVRRVV